MSQRRSAHDIFFSCLFGLIALGVLCGFFWVIGEKFASIQGQYPDDTDCEFKSPIVDERPPECHEICRDGHAWFVWGKEQYCYWDDNATAGAR